MSPYRLLGSNLLVVVVRPVLPIAGPVDRKTTSIERLGPFHYSDPYHWNARSYVSFRSSFNIGNGKVAVLDFDSHSPITIRLTDQNVSATITFGRKNGPLDINLKPAATKLVAKQQFRSEVFMSFATIVRACSTPLMGEMMFDLPTLPNENHSIACCIGAAEFGAAINVSSYDVGIIENSSRD